MHGPFKIPYEKRKGGRFLVLDDFWTEESGASQLAYERGVYVFAIRNGRGIKPIYVGKATKTFQQETFNPSNRNKYSNGFSEYAKGLPMMYFVVHPRQKGKVNLKAIDEIEGFLIQAGVAKNPDLQNVRGTQRPKWSIKGVIRTGKGKRNATETSFRTTFDIH